MDEKTLEVLCDLTQELKGIHAHLAEIDKTLKAGDVTSKRISGSLSVMCDRIGNIRDDVYTIANY